MPGITEQQLHKHSGLRTRQVILADSSPFAADFFWSDSPHALTVGSRLTVTDSGSFATRSVTVRITTDGTVATRVFGVRLTGEDQFGKFVSEDISVTATASQTVQTQGAVVIGKLTGIELLTNTATVAGDAVGVGAITIGGAGTWIGDEGVVYGLPVKVRSSADIVGGWMFEAGAEVDLDLGAHVTYNPHYNSVVLHSAVAPDGSSDRFVVLCVRTNDR